MRWASESVTRVTVSPDRCTLWRMVPAFSAGGPTMRADITWLSSVSSETIRSGWPGDRTVWAWAAVARRAAKRPNRARVGNRM